MSDLAAAPPPLPFFKGAPFFHEMGQAGQHLYEVLWPKTGFGQRPVRITDRELAELCERGIRWVQKALKQLCDFMAGDMALPWIERHYEYGPRTKAGRVIAITLPFSGRSADESPAPAKGRKSRGPSPSAAPQSAPAATSGASAATADGAASSPDGQEEAQRAWEEWRRAHAGEAARAKARIDRTDGRKRIRPEDLEPRAAGPRSVAAAIASKLGGLIGRAADGGPPAGPPAQPSGP